MRQGGNGGPCLYKPSLLAEPRQAESLLALAESKPSLILGGGAEPQLIDVWQEAPRLWDAVCFAIDRGRGRGRFILA